jgi:hypothetical protein
MARLQSFSPSLLEDEGQQNKIGFWATKIGSYEHNMMHTFGQ